MYQTRYHQAQSLAEAAALFAAAAEGRYLSGGQTLIPTMKQRLAAPTDLVDISRIAELKGIAATPGEVSIGAAMTHAEVHGSAAVRQAIPALADLAGMVGDPAVREMGTIGGSLANNDPAADYPAAVQALVNGSYSTSPLPTSVPRTPSSPATVLMETMPICDAFHRSGLSDRTTAVTGRPP